MNKREDSNGGSVGARKLGELYEWPIKCHQSRMEQGPGFVGVGAEGVHHNCHLLGNDGGGARKWGK